MDDRCDTDSAMAAGVGEQSHDGRICSHLAGGCHYRRVGQGHSGAENSLAGKRLLTNRTKPSHTNDQSRAAGSFNQV